MNNQEKTQKMDRKIEKKRGNVSEPVNELSRSAITLDIGCTNKKEIMGDMEQEIDEKTRTENVSDKESEHKEDRLALSLRPPWESPVKELSQKMSSPQPPFPKPPPELLQMTSRPQFIPNLFPHYQVTQQTKHPSESSTHAERIPPPPPSPSPPPPSPKGPTLPQPRNRNRHREDDEIGSIPAPYIWATTQRATVHSIEYLVSRQILIISGQVQCKRCERRFEMQYDLLEKFTEIGSFIAQNKSLMRDRAPRNWMSPTLPKCTYCGAENSVKPCIPAEETSINWLFLLLGQMIGCCTLNQLRFFCKHNNHHRTGAKDRVLYLTYLELCKQLDPSGPFSLR